MSGLFGLNWGELIVNILAIVGASAAIAKITPWTWDDKAVGWVIKILRAVGLQKK